jgi:hypothetical protein
MTATTAAFALAGIQLALIIALGADRWVHKVTGKSPLEARILRCEQMIENCNVRSSQKASELTVYLDTRRQCFDTLSERVAMIEGELRAMRNQRDDGSLIHERRREDRRR